MSQTVIGIFEHVNQAQEAKAYLVANGFDSENVDINIIAGSNYGDNSDSDEGTSLGDRISHFFTNLFDSDDEVNSHTAAARRGTTVTVHTTSENQTAQAVQVLDNFGAVDVNDFAQRGMGYGASTGDETLNTDLVNTSILDTGVLPGNTNDGESFSSDFDDNSEANRSPNNGAIPIIEEELQVGKQEVETGGVRMRSRIVERPVEESIRLRTEHVNVERTAVDRPATEGDFAAFKEGTVDVTEHAEIPVVSKDARVVEEVSLNKEVTESEQTISETLRRTEIESENLNDKTKNI